MPYVGAASSKKLLAHFKTVKNVVNANKEELQKGDNIGQKKAEEILKILEFLRETFVKKIEQIKHQIESREMKRFYICERCNVEYNEENALAHDFTCNECGSIFVLKDNTKIVKEFRKNLEKHLKEMELIDEEIVKEREKSGKKKLKEVKKEEEEKKKKRAEKRAATKKLKDLMKPKIKKKIAPKKASKKQKIKKVSKKKPKKRR